MRITEADYEYLLHTLSEARSRATEIAVSISARVGTDHPLAQFANGAAVKIERVLRGVQKNAIDQPETKPKVFEMPGTAAAAPTPALAEQHAASTPPWASFATEAGVGPEHWVSHFVDDLMLEVGSSGAIGFETAERLLQQHKHAFQRDLEITRRMYRNYPHLFDDESEEAGGPSAQSGRRTFAAKI